MPVEGLVGTRVCGGVFVSRQEPRKEDAVSSRWEVMAALTPVVAMATESWDCITDQEGLVVVAWGARGGGQDRMASRCRPVSQADSQISR